MHGGCLGAILHCALGAFTQRAFHTSSPVETLSVKYKAGVPITCTAWCRVRYAATDHGEDDEDATGDADDSLCALHAEVLVDGAVTTLADAWFDPRAAPSLGQAAVLRDSHLLASAPPAVSAAALDALSSPRCWPTADAMRRKIEGRGDMQHWEIESDFAPDMP